MTPFQKLQEQNVYLKKELDRLNSQFKDLRRKYVFYGLARDSAIERRNKILTSILFLVNEKEISIAQLSRDLKINRSTLRHYLGVLKSKNKILFERQLNTPGQPTIVKINKILGEK